MQSPQKYTKDKAVYNRYV